MSSLTMQVTKRLETFLQGTKSFILTESLFRVPQGQHLTHPTRRPAKL